MYDLLSSGQNKIAVIGLGYVGLPLALSFSRKFSVLGYDIHSGRIEQLRRFEDPSGEIHPNDFIGCQIEFTSEEQRLAEASMFIVTVPTPIDEHNNPDLRPILSASRTLSKYMKRGDYVVYESTVYPGCTEEDCIPVLEQSGLRACVDFKIGYSPERINPGDRINRLENTVKVVSACCEESLQELAKVYGSVIEAGLHLAPSIKVAEAAKIIENTQRDVNIALMNEFSLICNKLNINTYDVIEAAATKWNFIPFVPGLVGGHCIGVDPYYLTYKASSLGYHSEVILAGRAINDSMGSYVGGQLAKQLVKLKIRLDEAKILLMGLTFKENVSDIRNSKVVDLINELQSFNIHIDIFDPFADPQQVQHEYNLNLVPEPGLGYNAIVVAVAHRQFLALDEAWFKSRLKPDGLLADLKGLYRKSIKQLRYWSL
jgi:UDP-N-acetyl-D-galactosamine dehydrogenase